MTINRGTDVILFYRFRLSFYVFCTLINCYQIISILSLFKFNWVMHYPWLLGGLRCYVRAGKAMSNIYWSGISNCRCGHVWPQSLGLTKAWFSQQQGVRRWFERTTGYSYQIIKQQAIVDYWLFYSVSDFYLNYVVVRSKYVVSFIITSRYVD